MPKPSVDDLIAVMTTERQFYAKLDELPADRLAQANRTADEMLLQQASLEVPADQASIFITMEFLLDDLSPEERQSIEEKAKALAAESDARIDRHTYQVTWSAEDGEYICEWRSKREPDGGVIGSQSVRKVSSDEPDGYCRGFALPWAVGVA